MIKLVEVQFGQGMAFKDNFYFCDCGLEFLEEFVGHSYIVYCPKCDPVHYCEKTGKPYKTECDCSECLR